MLLAVATVVPAHAARAQRAASRVAPASAVVGTVRDTSGVPVPGALVRIGATGTATTDSGGRFVVAPLRPGRAPLAVSRSGFPALTMELVVRSGRADTLELYLMGALPASGSATPAAPIAPALPSPPVAVAVRPRPRPLTLRGVVSDTVGRPLVGALVAVVSQGRTALTDSAGMFDLTNLAPGAALVRVRRLGFVPRTFTASISAQDALIADVALVPAAPTLARVTTTAEALRRTSKLAGFFDRKRAGFGQFLGRDQFEADNPLRVTDLMTRFTGVAVGQDARGKRRIYGRGRCELAVFLDGMSVVVPEGSSVDDFLDVYEVDAVEVHNRISGLPPEFSARTNACGVIAFWTRTRAGR